MFGSDLMKLPGGTNWTRFMLPRKNWQILRYYHEIGKKSPVSRCHLQLTSATIKSTERPANQPTIEEEAFSPLASNSERGVCVCVCATAMFVMVASFTKCPCYSCYVENLISLKYSTVVMHCRWIDTLFCNVYIMRWSTRILALKKVQFLYCRLLEGLYIKREFIFVWLDEILIYIKCIMTHWQASDI